MRLLQDDGGSVERMEVLDNLAQWVTDDALDKNGLKVDTSKWPRIIGDCPQQNNDSDCGVFALM
jgi:Ulp1 family protease